MAKMRIGVILTIFTGGMLITCSRSQNSAAGNFTELALQGKAIFELKECGKCHYVGDELVEDPGPDLLNPFLANDSLFIQTHFRFLEQSKMPPIELTQDQIRKVSYYVAELHRVKNSVMTDDGDVRCPVCYAAVSSEQAQAKRLSALVVTQKYYFDCDDCFNLFRRAPEAFVEFMRQHDVAASSLSR